MTNETVNRVRVVMSRFESRTSFLQFTAPRLPELRSIYIRFTRGYVALRTRDEFPQEHRRSPR